ncbi:hypothetical protein OBBRIDRAFT_32612 [Obba rivulosa]|uniref:Secreted protein n=1 Tax=Obba rivulosa TaxID=1052685 RepID=A0A8E2ARD1_9APHY|nr:hypothetical protein OBBRIDRAFT_32612 [Obba rivulosa]
MGCCTCRLIRIPLTAWACITMSVNEHTERPVGDLREVRPADQCEQGMLDGHEIAANHATSSAQVLRGSLSTVDPWCRSIQATEGGIPKETDTRVLHSGCRHVRGGDQLREELSNPISSPALDQKSTTAHSRQVITANANSINSSVSLCVIFCRMHGIY